MTQSLKSWGRRVRGRWIQQLNDITTVMESSHLANRSASCPHWCSLEERKTFPKVLKQHSLQNSLHKHPILNHLLAKLRGRVRVWSHHTHICAEGTDLDQLRHISGVGLPCCAWPPQQSKEGGDKYPFASVASPSPG